MINFDSSCNNNNAEETLHEIYTYLTPHFVYAVLGWDLIGIWIIIQTSEKNVFRDRLHEQPHFRPLCFQCWRIRRAFVAVLPLILPHQILKDAYSLTLYRPIHIVQVTENLMSLQLIVTFYVIALFLNSLPFFHF